MVALYNFKALYAVNAVLGEDLGFGLIGAEDIGKAVGYKHAERADVVRLGRHFLVVLVFYLEFQVIIYGFLYFFDIGDGVGDDARHDRHYEGVKGRVAGEVLEEFFKTAGEPAAGVLGESGHGVKGIVLFSAERAVLKAYAFGEFVIAVAQAVGKEAGFVHGYQVALDGAFLYAEVFSHSVYLYAP